MSEGYIVVHCLENAEATRSLDIVEQPNGLYRWQVWRRDAEDVTGWILCRDSLPMAFESAADAVEAAKANISWQI